VAPELPQIGALIADRYRLTEKIGEGGMGAVYAAEHVVLGKLLAIKFLNPQRASDEEAVQRLHREAQAATAVGHQGVVEIFDVGWTEDRIPFLVMEYLHGESLEQILNRELRFEPAQAIEVAKQTLAALIVVHKQGIIHRDLKPANIFVVRTRDGNDMIKLLDFGVSKIQTDDVTAKLTRTGAVFGTPHYMSPELASGEKDIDGRVDIWAMGVILYEMLTGRVPYEGESYNALLAKILIAPYAPPREIRPDIPEDLERVILKAMTKEREHRYQRAAEFLEDLLECDDARTQGALPRTTPSVVKPLEVASDGPTERDLSTPSDTAVATLPYRDEVSDSATLPRHGVAQSAPSTLATAPDGDAPSISAATPLATVTKAEHPLAGTGYDGRHVWRRRVALATASIATAAVVGILLVSVMMPSEQDDASSRRAEERSLATAYPVERSTVSATTRPTDGGQPDGSAEPGTTEEPASSTGDASMASDSGGVSEADASRALDPAREDRSSPSSVRRARTDQAATALRPHRNRLQACLSRGVRPPPELRVSVSVEPSGRLRYLDASPSPPTQVVSCLSEIIAGISLPAASGEPISVTVPVKRRARPVSDTTEQATDQSPLEANPFQ